MMRWWIFYVTSAFAQIIDDSIDPLDDDAFDKFDSTGYYNYTSAAHHELPDPIPRMSTQDIPPGLLPKKQFFEPMRINWRYSRATADFNSLAQPVLEEGVISAADRFLKRILRVQRDKKAMGPHLNCRFSSGVPYSVSEYRCSEMSSEARGHFFFLGSGDVAPYALCINGGGCRTGFTLSEGLLHKGSPDTDMTISVTAVLNSTNCTAPSSPNRNSFGVTVAYGIHDDRPTGLVLILCNNLVQHLDGTNRSKTQLLMNIIHEVLAALGLHISTLPFTVDKFGKPRTARLPQGMPRNGGYHYTSDVVKRYTFLDGRVIRFLTTPSAVKVAHELLGCTDVPGLALDSNTFTGKNFWPNSLHPRQSPYDLASTHQSWASVFTPMTIAPIEDSGLARVEDFWAMKDYWWADKKLTNRCDIFYNKCMDSSSDPPVPADSKRYCTGTKYGMHYGCTPDHQYVAKCWIWQKPANIDAWGSNWGVSSKKGGKFEVFDYCPAYWSFEENFKNKENWMNCHDLDNNTSIPATASHQVHGAIYSSSSRCIQSSLIWATMPVNTTPSNVGVHCYKVNCIPKNSTAAITEDTVWDHIEITYSTPTSTETISCTKEEEELEITGVVTGKITCPKFEDVCFGYPCQNGGQLKDNICICKPGFFGHLCQYSEFIENIAEKPYSIGYGDYWDVSLLINRSYSIKANVIGRFTSVHSERPLPAGLYLDSNSGDIVGTPTAVTSSCERYVITITNGDDKGYGVIHLRVVAGREDVLPDPTLEWTPCGRVLPEYPDEIPPFEPPSLEPPDEVSHTSLPAGQFLFERNSFFQPLSVRIVTDEFEQKLSNQFDYLSLWKETIIPRTVSWLSRAITVRKSKETNMLIPPCPAISSNISQTRFTCKNIRNDYNICNEHTIPLSYFIPFSLCSADGTCQVQPTGPGVAGDDFIVFLTLKDDHAGCHKTPDQAPARFSTDVCTFDTDDRGTSAVINLCQGHLQNTMKQNYSIVGIIKEFIGELLIAIGLHWRYLPFARSMDGTPKITRGEKGLPPFINGYFSAEKYATVSTLFRPINQSIVKHPYARELEWGNDFSGAGSFGLYAIASNYGIFYQPEYPKGASVGSGLAVVQHGPTVASAVCNYSSHVTQGTLAILQDLGWYRVDVKMGKKNIWLNKEIMNLPSITTVFSPEPYYLGNYDMGIKSTWRIADLTKYHWCPLFGESLRWLCSQDNQFIAKCEMNENKRDNGWKLDYGHEKFGRLFETEYRPLRLSYDPDYNPDYFAMNCKDPRFNSLDAEVHHGAIYSGTSGCLRTTLVSDTPPSTTSPFSQHHCYKFTCVHATAQPNEVPSDDNWQSLNVTFMSGGVERVVICTEEGKGIDVTDPKMSGKIYCPNIKLACHDYPCENLGTRDNGICICAPGTFGDRCQYEETPENIQKYGHDLTYGISGITAHVNNLIELTPRFTGELSKFTVHPDLPAGIYIDEDTGKISGKPQVATSCEEYTIIGEKGAHRAITRLRIATRTLSFFSPIMATGKYVQNDCMEVKDESIRETNENEVHISAMPEETDLLKKETYQPFRLYFDKTGLTNKIANYKNKEVTKFDYILRDIQLFIQNYVRLRVPTTPMLLIPRCLRDDIIIEKSYISCREMAENWDQCGYVPVPRSHFVGYTLCSDDANCYEAHKGDGLKNVDGVVYLSTGNTECGPGQSNTDRFKTVNCAFDFDDRPTGSNIEICSDQFNKIMTGEIVSRVARLQILHEVFSALGWNIKHFAFFRDRAHNPINPRYKYHMPPMRDGIHMTSTDKFVHQEIHPNKSLNFYVDPPITDLVAEKFNCQELIGLPLTVHPDYGITANLHPLIAGFDILSDIVHSESRVTWLTGVALRSTGWYWTESELETSNPWHHNVDVCELMKEDCGNPMGPVNSFADRLCKPDQNETIQTTHYISQDKTSISRCVTMIEPSDNEGSQFCGLILPVNTSNDDRNLICTSNDVNNVSTVDGVKVSVLGYGDNSRAVESSINQNAYGELLNSPIRCHEVVCSEYKRLSGHGKLVVYAQSDEVNGFIHCKKEDAGEFKDLAGLDGYVKCPEIIDYCKNAHCQNGEYKNFNCVCYPGYIGKHCEYEDIKWQLEYATYILGYPTLNYHYMVLDNDYRFPVETGISETKYTLLDDLPPGLNLDSRTGIISGRPTSFTPCKKYRLWSIGERHSVLTVLNFAVLDTASLYEANFDYGDCDVPAIVN